MTYRPVRTIAAAAVAAILLAPACGTDEGERPALPLVGVEARAADTAALQGEALLYPERPVEYRVAEGATAPAPSAPAYRLVADDAVDDDAARLARAFGIEGEPDEEEGGARTVVVRSGRSVLQVDDAGVVSWTYLRDPEASVRSDVAVACPPDAADCPAPAPPPPVEGLPSAAEAEVRARELLIDAGIDLAGAEAEAVEEGTQSRTVAFTPVVDGRSVVDLRTTVTFGEHGRVEYAGGFLGEFEKVGDYPLVDLDTAVERLRSGFDGPATGRPAIDTPALAEDDPVVDEGAGQSEPGAPGEDRAVPPPDLPPPDLPPPPPPPDPEPEIVEITGADVVLMVVYPACPDDLVYVVPAFAFTPEAAGTVAAVADDDLDQDAGAAGREPRQPCPGTEPPAEPSGREPAPLPTEVAPLPAPSPEPEPSSSP